MTENNGNGRIVRLEVNEEWLKTELQSLKADVKEVDRKVNGLMVRVAAIGGSAGILGGLVALLLGAHLPG